jgi:hypothetical protein
MRCQLIVAGAAALLLASSLQVSAEVTMGNVTSIDAKSGTITLSDGKVYTVNLAFLSNVIVGDLVTVTYAADSTGKLTASAVSKQEEEGYR